MIGKRDEIPKLDGSLKKEALHNEPRRYLLHGKQTAVSWLHRGLIRDPGTPLTSQQYGVERFKEALNRDPLIYSSKWTHFCSYFDEGSVVSLSK